MIKRFLKAKLIALLLVGTAGGLNAVQRLEETQEIPCGVLSQTSSGVDCLWEEIQPKISQAPLQESTGVAAGKSREVPSVESTPNEKSPKKEKRISTSDSSQTKELLRPMRGEVYEVRSPRSRPLSPNAGMARVVTQHMQSSNRISLRLTRTLPQGSTVSAEVVSFAIAIARAEGWFLAKSLPARCHNPGDLKAVRGYSYPGQAGVCKGGHARFKTDKAGWAALEHQIAKAIDGSSRVYSVDMTLDQLSRRYAANHRQWAKNVAKNLGVPVSSFLWEIVDTAPSLVVIYKSEAPVLCAILATTNSTPVLSATDAFAVGMSGRSD